LLGDALLKKIIYVTIAVAIIIAIAFNIHEIISRVFPSTEIPPNAYYAIKAVATALGIIWITYAIASTIRVRLSQLVGTKAYQIATLIKISGYLIAVLAVVAMAGADLSGLLAGGVVTGLVLGIALQPVLSNFFAGILIMSTRMVEIGNRVRILSTSIPYVVPILPAYKFFSVDFVETGFKGVIVDMNFFYAKMVTDEGRELKIPNMMLMNAAIVDYSPEFSKKETVSVRVELPLQSINPAEIEDRVRNALQGFEIVSGPYLNEQSDKEHVIVIVKLGVSNGEDWRRVKSEALKRLLTLRKQLVEAMSVQKTA
jgi:small-conductance mechanosensitive channel